jgi:hypothetical protein
MTAQKRTLPFTITSGREVTMITEIPRCPDCKTLTDEIRFERKMGMVSCHCPNSKCDVMLFSIGGSQVLRQSREMRN